MRAAAEVGRGRGGTSGGPGGGMLLEGAGEVALRGVLPEREAEAGAIFWVLRSCGAASGGHRQPAVKSCPEPLSLSVPLCLYRDTSRRGGHAGGSPGAIC